MTTAAVRRLSIPSPEELIERARAMVPEIRALAEETERNRNLSPHIVEQIRDAELLRTCRPRMFGGFEYDGEVALTIALTISAACASTGWTVNGAVSNGLSLGHWPIEAQRELWEGDADPFTFACFAPTGTAVPVDGGYRLNGTWSFASGCDIAQWGKLGAMITPPGKEPPYEGAFFLLPVEDCEIVDNWFVCGLSGTGSKDIVARDVFVSTGRHVLGEVEARGWRDALERAGVTLVVDTCTYITPILRDRDRVVMTNSAKWAYYAPANLGVQVVFGSLEECVRSAELGRVWRDGSLWSEEPADER